MSAVDSFWFTLANEGGDTPIPSGLKMRSAEGAIAKPDKVDLQVRGQFAGLFVELRVISLDGKTYVSNPLTGGSWQSFDSKLSPVAFFDPVNGISLILRSLETPTLSKADMSGTAVYQVRGSLPASSMQFIAGSYAAGSTLDAELSIGLDDPLLRQVRLAGKVTADEPPGIVRILTFSNFDKPFTFAPPV